MLMQLKFELEVGELPVGELALAVLGICVVLVRGVGAWIRGRTIAIYAAASFLMLLGYLVSDLVAQTTPAQYLRGWARVAMLGLDLAALLIVVSHGARLLAWFVLGVVLGILCDFMVREMPFTALNFKLGYGYALVLLLALVSGFLGRFLASLLLALFGAASILLDFRSLGAVSMLAAGIHFVHVLMGRSRRHWGRGAIAALLLLAAAAGLGALTFATEDAKTELRRKQSDIGRIIGITVAAQAVTDSPLVGYGSWAGDKNYVALYDRALARATTGTQIRITTKNESMLPHSQVLQAWVEGGVLAAAFFLLYAWHGLASLRWLALRHAPDRLTPLYLILVLMGLWNLAASPFLGPHRTAIECSIAALALLARERWAHARTTQVTAARRLY